MCLDKILQLGSSGQSQSALASSEKYAVHLKKRDIVYLVIVVQSFSCIRPFATPWTIAHKAPLSNELLRQEYWSGLPFPSPGDLPKPDLLHCRQVLYHLSHQGSPSLP